MQVSEVMSKGIRALDKPFDAVNDYVREATAATAAQAQLLGTMSNNILGMKEGTLRWHGQGV